MSRRALMLRQATLGVSLCALAACGSYFTSEAPVAQTYVLRAPITDQPASEASAARPVAAGPAVRDSIAVRISRPAAAPGLETDRILLTRDGRELDFYAAGRWAAPIPDMLGSLAIETLRGRAGIGTVYGEGTPFPSDYVLHIVVRRFDADYGDADYGDAQGAPAASVVLDCTLGRRLDRAVIATFVIEARQPADANRLGAVVRAYEAAAHAALEELVDRTSAALAQDAAAFSAIR